MTSLLRKAKPRSILASDGNLPRCHQRHMERRRGGITPALFRNKAAQFLSPCRRARQAPSRSLVSSVQAPIAAKPARPLATWCSPSKRRPRCSESQAGWHRHRFFNRRSLPLLLGKKFDRSRRPISHSSPLRAGSPVALVLDLDETIEVGAKHIGHGVGVGFDLCGLSRGFRKRFPTSLSVVCDQLAGQCTASLLRPRAAPPA